MIASTAAYITSILITESHYRLSKDSTQLIGTINSALAKKIKLDQSTGTYRFNAENISPDMMSETDPAKVAVMLASQKQQTGGGGKDTKNLYSLDLPIDPQKGTAVYDSNSRTSFKLIPQFAIDKGRSEDGRIVYPLNEGGQAIYSVKGNGIKEDIVLTKPRGNQLSFSYRLDLPKTLEARIDAQGNLGVYSVDPALTSAVAGNLAGGSLSTDTARLKDIQENGTKDHLAYLIPAPTIKQSGDSPSVHKAKAKYELKNNILTVHTDGLETLTYPISIDPTVVVTSTADFGTGNNEGMIQYDTDIISRAYASGGSVGTWATTTALSTPTVRHASVAYNGYIYTLGGSNGGVSTTTVRYAPINTDGTIGAWASTTSLPAASTDQGVVAYSGYMYNVGGNDSGVRYAPINADGTLGTWKSTTSLSSILYNQGTVASNGYIYQLGGRDNNALHGDVLYAPVNGDGTLGAWTSTTSLPSARNGLSATVYNGYVYAVGGYDGTAYLTDVLYAPLNADGTLGVWTGTTGFATGRTNEAAVAYNGYLYVYGGARTTSNPFNDVQYAPITASGAVGAWASTTSFTGVRQQFGYAAYNGHLYLTGGGTNSTAGTIYSDVQTVAINTTPDQVANMYSWIATTTFGAGKGSASAQVTTRANHGSAVYNGYIYLVGGSAPGATLTSVHYAPLNANGTIGAWAQATSLPLARAGMATVAVNGYLYAIGGQDNTPTIAATSYVAPINADGTIGSWTTTTPLTSARTNEGIVYYNGYMYTTGGLLDTAGTLTTRVEYAPVNADGTIGTWVITTALPAGLAAHSSVAYNGRLYAIGGALSAGTTAEVKSAPINADGTVGSWMTTTSLPSGRSYTMARVYQGYVFLVGGYSKDAGADTTTTYYAKLNDSGAVGSWSSGPAFTTAREGLGVEIYNGYLYLTGGWNGANTFYGDTQYSLLSMTAGGPSGVQPWQSTTSAALAVYGQSSVVYNNVIYVIGGYGGGVYQSSVRYAPINADGTVGVWVTANGMSMARFNAGAVAYKGYLYVTGGQQGASAFTNTTEYAPINADGSLGTWTTSANTFTTARYGHVTAASNGYLYVVGGGDAANTALGDVKYAVINADGSIGTWADTTATTADRDTDGFIYGDRLYILGGVNGTTYSNTVRSAAINSDGTIGAWTTASSTFTTARSRLAAVAIDGYVYISGGANTAGLGDMQYASISSSGFIGTWKTGNSTSAVAGAPALYYYHTMIANKGRLYSLCGVDGTSTAQGGVFTTVLNTPAQVGTFTKTVDLGLANTLNSITVNGTLSSEQSSILFKVAGNDGVFGGWQPTSALAGAPLTNVRYVMYKTVLNDSNATGRSYITDITANYTVVDPGLTTANRLRQNKYFDINGVLQPLQTQ
jgi:N-acetylneuraminic acid mutarotase